MIFLMISVPTGKTTSADQVGWFVRWFYALSALLELFRTKSFVKQLYGFM